MTRTYVRAHKHVYTNVLMSNIYQIKKNRSTASTVLLHKTQRNLCVSTAYLSTHRFGCIAVQIVSLVYLIWILSFCLLIFCYFSIPLSLSLTVLALMLLVLSLSYIHLIYVPFHFVDSKWKVTLSICANVPASWSTFIVH